MTTPTNLVELLPCPFCGTEIERLSMLSGEPSDTAWHRDADCILSVTSIAREKWEGWNTRAALQVIPVREER